MRNFSVVAKKNEKSSKIEKYAIDKLIHAGWNLDKQNPDIVLCIGGDGTLLYAVHKYLHLLDRISFVGVHTGTLGFFTDYTEEEIDICIDDILNKEPEYFESPLLQIEVDKERYYALNEMRIENVKRTQEIDVYIDGELFEKCRGSGICLSTQAGSTAYNRSLGGAVIDSGLHLLQMAEITAIQHSRHRSLGNPYIMKKDRIIEFKSDDFTDAVLCYDHLYIELKKHADVICTTSQKYVRFARYRAYSYLKRLKNLY